VGNEQVGPRVGPPAVAAEAEAASNAAVSSEAAAGLDPFAVAAAVTKVHLNVGELDAERGSKMLVLAAQGAAMPCSVVVTADAAAGCARGAPRSNSARVVDTNILDVG
jgi:hypothetical protein